MTSNVLTINALSLELYLGWPDDERSRRQTILLDIQLHYPSVPKACETDHLDDTVCYRHLIESLRKKLEDKKFHLIEHVTQAVYQHLKSLTPTDTRLTVSLTKRPQIAGLGSVTFNYGDSLN